MGPSDFLQAKGVVLWKDCSTEGWVKQALVSVLALKNPKAHRILIFLIILLII